jgi:hypothetical protein
MNVMTIDIEMESVQRFARKVFAKLTPEQMGPLSAVAIDLGFFQSASALLSAGGRRHSCRSE